MDKAEATGFGLAVAGHAALLAVLSAGFATASRETPMAPPMDVSFVEDVDVVSAAPEPTTEAPAQSIAPDFGMPEEAAPIPEPTPQPVQPLPPPPTPLPMPMPPKAVEAPPKPSPKPAAKPAPQKPAPKAAPSPPKTPARAAKPAPAQAKPKVGGEGKAEQTRASRLGSDFLKGLGGDPSTSTSQKPSGAVMGAQAKASIGSAILRQVQPCANQQVKPGPGAERIRVTINLRLNRDGSLAARPRVVGRTGVDDENRRYADRVDDLAVATFVGCSPLRGLPAELYDVKGGWSNFSLRYKLPD